MTVITTSGFSQKTVRLYDGKAPGSENWNYEEVEYLSPYFHKRCFRNVVDPTLEVYYPDKSIATGTAVVICPGGGFYYLEYENEGTAVAEWLVKKGITAFVLKYRVTQTPASEEDYIKWTQDWNKALSENSNTSKVSGTRPGIPSVAKDKIYGGDDGIKALEYIRGHADEYNIDPQKVGIMGFSAGAGVTIYTILHSDPDKQPNFAAPIYGGMFGDFEVPDNVPPLFIAAAANDPIITNMPDLYKKWKDAGKSAELHIYSKGSHGFGMRKQNMPADTWIERFYDWLKTTGF